MPTREELQQALQELGVQVAGTSVNPSLYNRDELATNLAIKLKEMDRRYIKVPTDKEIHGGDGSPAVFGAKGDRVS